MSNSSLSSASSTATRTTGSQAKFESPARNAELYGTGTSFGRSTVGTHSDQSANPVVAARPSAGRSPAVARSAKCRSPAGCRTRMGSGTLPLVKYTAVLHRMRQPAPSVALVVACGSGGKTRQSSAKVSQCRAFAAWLGPERTGSGSKTAPNPSVEGMAKRLRLLPTPHLER